MKTLKLILAMAFVSAFVGCANDDDYDAPDLTGQCNDLTVTKQVQDIIGMATGTYQKYEADDIIEAYVTSSDEAGNFYKTISFVSVDGTKGFSMPVDAYNTFNKYEPGRKVFIHMKDRYFVNDNLTESTIIGSLFNNSTPEDATDDKVGRISGIEYETVLTRSCTKINEDEIVKHVTINEAMHDEYLNMLVEFDSVQFTDPSKGKNYYDEALPSPGGATNHEIIDREGKKVTLRVSSFATYAGNAVPVNSG